MCENDEGTLLQIKSSGFPAPPNPPPPGGHRNFIFICAFGNLKEAMAGIGGQNDFHGSVKAHTLSNINAFSWDYLIMRTFPQSCFGSGDALSQSITQVSVETPPPP